jgi:phospholipid/cholesterol/gamma-HCH transport system substrate-binding protein
MRESKSNYIIVGAFVVAVVTALILWITLLSGGTGASDPYTIEFSNVAGLKTGVEILYEGYPMGLIEAIEPLMGAPLRYRVDVRVKRDWPIPEDSLALISAGLFSAAVIDIQAGSSKKLLAVGAEIPSSEAGDSFAAMGAAASSASEALEELKPTLAAFRERVPEIMGNVTVISEKLETSVDQLNQVLGRGNLERIESILANMDHGVSDASRVVKDLGKTRTKLDGVIQKVDDILDEEQGDLSVAIADLRYSLATLARHMDSISANLEATTRNMSEFSRRIRDNPGVLLRGQGGSDDD